MIELESESTQEAVVSNSSAGRWLGVAAGAALTALVAIGLVTGGGDDQPDAATTLPPTSVASTTTTTSPAENPDRPVAAPATTTEPPARPTAGRVPPIDATVIALDQFDDLVLIDVESDEVTNLDLFTELGVVTDIAPYGDGFVIVDQDGVLLLRSDFAPLANPLGRPIAWDESTIWATSIRDTQTEPELFVHQAGEPSIAVPGPNFAVTTAGIDSGTLLLDSPTGVVALGPDGQVGDSDILVHLRRGPVRLVTACDGLSCRLELRHDDGHTVDLPDDSDVDEIAVSWDGRLVAGGPPRDGWILNTTTGVVGSLIRPDGELSFAVGADLLVVAQGRLVRLLDTTGLPEGSIGLAWQVTLPTNTRTGVLLVVGEDG